MYSSPFFDAARSLVGLSLLAILASGCASIGLIDPPIPLDISLGPLNEVITPRPGESRRVSIGDEVVRYEVYGRMPVGLRFMGREVPVAGWKAAFTRDGKTLYSNRRFFRGQIGLDLDEDLNIREAGQIGGFKKWRTWDGEGQPLFAYKPLLVESWILRYGGKVDNVYRFDLVEKLEDSQSDVIQPLRIEEASFLTGFVVRGVTLRGLVQDRNGVIEYEAEYVAPLRSLEPKQIELDTVFVSPETRGMILGKGRNALPVVEVGDVAPEVFSSANF
ncbi:MAG: hypothetical protein AB8G23_18660 [Myxococcota bacterium]